MKYKFIKLIDKDNEFDNTQLTMDVEATTIDEILKAFQDFLKGSGFVFDGIMDIIEEEK